MYSFLLALVALVASDTQAIPEPSSLLLLEHPNGVKVTAIVPQRDATSFGIEIYLSEKACQLLRETPQQRPPGYNKIKLLVDGEEKQVLDSIGQCWRWYDNQINGTAYEHDIVRLPKLKSTVEVYKPFGIPLNSFTRYQGECTDGYWLSFRKPDEDFTKFWDYHAGRELQLKQCRARISLIYDHDAKNFAKIAIDGESIIDSLPGYDFFDGRFMGYYQRSRLWKEIDSPDFQLVLRRLGLICQDEFESLLARVRNSTGAVDAHLTYTLGAHATSAILIQRFEGATSQTKRTLEGTNTTISGAGWLSNQTLVVPGLVAAKADLSSSLGIQFSKLKKSESERSDSFALELKELPRSFPEPVSAIAYLCMVWNALGQIKSNFPEETHILVTSLTEEAAVSLTVR